eukprot:scaffold12619_cov133-Skeletonema_menzelii.AAC.7
METKPRSTAFRRAREASKSKSGRVEANAETEVRFANETYGRQNVHNIDNLIMSLEIGSLDENNSFA